MKPTLDYLPGPQIMFPVASVWKAEDNGKPAQYCMSGATLLFCQLMPNIEHNGTRICVRLFLPYSADVPTRALPINSFAPIIPWFIFVNRVLIELETFARNAMIGPLTIPTPQQRPLVMPPLNWRETNLLFGKQNATLAQEIWFQVLKSFLDTVPTVPGIPSFPPGPPVPILN